MKKGNRKFLGSIASYVMAFICITSWVALGVVLALTSVNIGVNGNISFTANDVYADVTGTVTGTATTNTLEDIHLTADTTNFTTPSSWSNINFDFVKGQDIVFTINITNKSTERSIWVSFTDSISATNTTITRKSAGEEVYGGYFGDLVVPKSTTKSVEITLHVTNSNESVSGNFSLGLDLTSLAPAKDESEYPTLSFSVNYESNTAEVGAHYSNKPTGNLVIPSSVIVNGQEYVVVGISGSYSFANCSQLTSVIIPEHIAYIGGGAFMGCSALTSIKIPGVTSIEPETFGNCSSLTSITIPANVREIGNNAFSGCSKLTSATFENTTGWKAGDTALSSSDLADKSKAATFLASTYDSKSWTRS